MEDDPNARKVEKEEPVCPSCGGALKFFFSLDFCDQSNRHCPHCGALLPPGMTRGLRPWYTSESGG